MCRLLEHRREQGWKEREQKKQQYAITFKKLVLILLTSPFCI